MKTIRNTVEYIAAEINYCLRERAFRKFHRWLRANKALLTETEYEAAQYLERGLFNAVGDSVRKVNQNRSLI